MWCNIHTLQASSDIERRLHIVGLLRGCIATFFCNIITFLISRPCLQQGWQVRVLLLWTLLLRQATLLLCPGSGEPRHISQHFPWHQWGGFCCWLQHNSNKGRMRAIFKHWLFYHFMHSIIVSFKYPGIYLRRRGEFSQKDFGQDSNRFLSRDPTLSSWPDLLANPLGLGSGCFR